MISVVTASCLTAYAFYTTAPETRDKFQTDRLAWTIPFVLYGIFRYLYLVHRKEQGGSPTDVLLTDRPLLVDVCLWALAVVAHRLHRRRAARCPWAAERAVSFEIKAEDVDVDAIMRSIRKRIEEKKQAALHGRGDPGDRRAPPGRRARRPRVQQRLHRGLPREPGRWNYHFGPETIYRSSRGGWGGLLERRAARCCARSRSSSGTRTP